MKNAIFWDVEPCRSLPHLQGRKTTSEEQCYQLAVVYFYPEDGSDMFL
jgi:hypothetical protein